MQVITTKAEMRRLVRTARAYRSAQEASRATHASGAGGSSRADGVEPGPAVVGLVPTMGFLHEGHLSLARRARSECDLVVMSVFVNPTQFGPEEDLESYPRDLGRDVAVAEEAGVDVVFHPSAAEMYAPGHATWVDVEGLTEHLCGASRPGHFRGVTTVVSKLFAVCEPDRAYFGSKDAQQALVIRRMARDLDQAVEVIVCPTMRESDGLAMSSRNAYLTPAERAQAPVLRRALVEAEVSISGGERDPRVVVAAVVGRLAEAPSASVDYVEVVSTTDLRPTDRIDGEVLVAAAIRLGATRLIDNVVVSPPG